MFSQSVLEHVRDPFACAREMIRVLKEGGVLLADVPFLAPFHGYPDHYFNVSMNGLRQLFASLEEVGVREGPHHAPALTLFEVLSRFCAMMREDGARKTVLDLTVRELLDHLQTGRHPELTRDLDPERTYTISAGFSFYGIKRPAPRRRTCLAPGHLTRRKRDRSASNATAAQTLSYKRVLLAKGRPRHCRRVPQPKPAVRASSSSLSRPRARSPRRCGGCRPP